MQAGSEADDDMCCAQQHAENQGAHTVEFGATSSWIRRRAAARMSMNHASVTTGKRMFAAIRNRERAGAKTHTAASLSRPLSHAARADATA
ncbi:hypothetical protein EASAB2608_08309 [Streptomyces sp. EAS-AB2608]|nr:hypothetical protein EASAB2608_08309 [Streptomyces sp. EAS-AB2608]